MNYVSLFSSGGVGCFGFKQERFDGIATSELIERRLDVQRANNKIKYDEGYILGDITKKEIKKKLYNAVNSYKEKENVSDVDVIIFTPPCQGMSVANHKKNDEIIEENSLVVEALKIVKEIKPKFFVSENVRAFMNTICIDHNNPKKIREAFKDWLSHDYIYEDKIINFKDYGANSSRTRTLILGVRKDLQEHVHPLDLFPEEENEKNLIDVIGHLPILNKMGEIDPNDIYHNFKPYREDMRLWISDISEGESAFDNKDVTKRPHKIVNGKIIPNVKKNGDKYTRQSWNKVAPCIHTRNDTMSSQNTIHPTDDRVFSIRELMLMMNIPKEFKWVEISEKDLNNLSLGEKRIFLKKNEINIRQCIGEAVPTIIMRKIAKNIKNILINEEKSQKNNGQNNLQNHHDLINFIKNNPENLSVEELARIAELQNTNRSKTAAYYTDFKTLKIIEEYLPTIEKDIIRILEPSAGIGNFLQILINKYKNAKHLIIDLNDIDEKSIEIIKLLNEYKEIPNNVEINFYHQDFLDHDFKKHYDLVVGNPPFLKLSQKTGLKKYSSIFNDNVTKNISGFFLQKATQLGDNVALILPKYFLHNPDFTLSRHRINKFKIETIVDFGEKGFKGILIETIALFIDTLNKPSETISYSVTKNIVNKQRQSLITSEEFPSWIIYRNQFFESLASKMIFNVFSSFRDRQITNKLLKNNGEIRVIKSRNISRDGTEIIHIDGYDSFINKDDLENLAVNHYLERDDVYLCPNMTYYPRIVKKPKNVVTNGSVAILENISDLNISEADLKFFSSDIFEEFYRIARNYSTRSLNIDSNSVIFFGLIKK